MHARWFPSRIALLLSVMLASAAGPVSAQTWAAPANLTNTPNTFSVSPSFTIDSRGKLHIVWVEQDESKPDPYTWKTICYMNNDTPGGTFTAPEQVRIPGYWLYDRTVHLTRTSDDTLHMSVTAKICCYQSVETVIYLNKPAGGAWSLPLLLTRDDGSEFVRSHGIIALPDDSVFVLMVDDNNGYPRLLDRVRSPSGTWMPEETLYTSSVNGRWPSGWCGLVGGDLYVCYDQPFAGGGACYRVKRNGTWGDWVRVGYFSAQTAGRLTIAKSPVSGELAAVYGYDTGDGENFGSGNLNFDIYARFSMDDGATWTPQVRVSPGNSLDRGAGCVYDAAGNLHIVWYGQVVPGDYGSLLYRKRSPDGTWGPQVNVSANTGRTSTAFNPIQVTGNKLYLVYSNTGSPPSGPGYEDVWYTTMTSPVDDVPPGPVTGLVAVPGEERVNLTWRNPSDSDLQSVVVRESISGYPANAHSGNLIGVLPASPGIDQSFLAIPLMPGVMHYFSVFAEDRAGNFSPAAQVAAIPVEDVTPPGIPITFTATSDYTGKIDLTWSNAADPDLKGAVIRLSTSGYPPDPGSGSLVVDLPGSPGAAQSYQVPGLTRGTTYYFSAFAYDAKRNYSAPAGARATVIEPQIGPVKQLPDGTQVALWNKVITAVFGGDACIYVEDQSRASGVRVATPTAGLSVGDTVHISGVMSTRMLSGQRSERQISAAVVTQATNPPTNSPLRPLAMGCRGVGGAAVGLNPGVIGGVGANTMGLLVRVAGKVTAKVTQYIYIDDGSGIRDPSGRTGIMVKCPDTGIPARVGDLVSVTGVVEGSIPTGWTSNRRLIHLRDYTDLTVFASSSASARSNGESREQRVES